MVDDTARTDEAIEDELGIQLEQAIKECNDELGLIPKMAEWQPWDVPADYTVCRHLLPTWWLGLHPSLRDEPVDLCVVVSTRGTAFAKARQKQDHTGEKSGLLQASPHLRCMCTGGHGDRGGGARRSQSLRSSAGLLVVLPSLHRGVSKGGVRPCWHSLLYQQALKACSRTPHPPQTQHS